MEIKNHITARDFLVAHRGYAVKYPENTLLAIQGALDAGARYIEIDVQLSNDQLPVVFHDRNLERLCQQQNAIHDYSFETIRTFSNYAPDSFGEKYLGTRIPTLREVVELLQQHKDVTLFVELKRISIDHFGIDNMLTTVLPLLEPIASQCVLISFSLDILDVVRSKTTFPIGAVIDEWQDAITKDKKRLESLSPEYFFCDIETLPARGSIQILNSKIVCYECTNPEQAKHVLSRGVTLVETFDIKNMIDMLDSNA